MKNPSKKPILPVSKKFHTYITDRINDACRTIGDNDDAAAKTLALVNRYITTGECDLTDADAIVRLIFTLLRPEIDRAISRSKAARLRAANRRAEKATEPTPIVPAPEPEPSAVADEMTEPGHSYRSRGAGRRGWHKEKFTWKRRG
ncbi:MAG: hypothetical protein NC212_05790 [Staphylococcus sp.]|nr:hypothetical protein [Staphylococcus sp.]